MNETTRAINNLTEPLTGQMLLFGLLGRVFYGYPDKQQGIWLQSLLDEDVFAETPFASEQTDVISGIETIQTWKHKCEGHISDTVFDALQQDYNMLFVGPNQLLAAPWGSIYLHEEALVLQKETLEVREWYRSFGLEAAKIYSEPDDHIGLELEFIAHLSRLALQAAEAGDEVELWRLLEEQYHFVVEQPGQWVIAWQMLVAEHGSTGFYRGAALMAVGAINALIAARKEQFPAVQIRF